MGGGGDGVKHGDLDSSMAHPTTDLDVHMGTDGLDMDCTDCHTTVNHHIAGSRYDPSAIDLHGKDLPISDGSLATCESCHGLEPMADAKLNDHVDKVACQTCHIPTFSREQPTKMWWDWSTAGQMGPDGKPYTEKDENGWVIYDTKKGDFVWAMDVVPEYIWYNGQTDFTLLDTTFDDTQPLVVNPTHGSADDPMSRIYPVKKFRGTQAYDSVNKTLAVPHLFGKDEAAYWKSYEWGPAIEAGMAAAGAPYSGEYDFIETEMNWGITHMVAPKTEALQCEECHTRDNGRLQDIEGIYMPSRDTSPPIDTLGWSIAGLAIVGVIVHGSARVVSRRKNGGKNS